MSATFATPKTPLEKQADGLDILSKFLSLNKDSVMAAGEETRRQMQLTADEKKKVDEAKTYIAKHAELDADLKRRENELANKHVEHELNVKQHVSHVASENTRLETFAATLATKQKEQEKLDKEQKAEADRLRGLSVDMERQHRDVIAACQKQEAYNTTLTQENLQTKATNEAENKRLKEWEATLKAKAQKIREQVANF